MVEFKQGPDGLEYISAPSGSIVKWDGDVFFLDHKGRAHNNDGPAIITSNQAKLWYKKGKLHRKDNPAVKRPDGTKLWYWKGKLRRIEKPNGEITCFYGDKPHNLDGPAIVLADGTKCYATFGVFMTEDQFNSCRMRLYRKIFRMVTR